VSSLTDTASAEQAYRAAARERAEELRASAAVSWRPCSACLALGGYRRDAPDGERWPVAGHAHARPEQLPPADDWRVWLLLAGRGFGKTRSAAEWMHQTAMANPGALGAIVPPTFADGRDICVEGPSGLLAVARRYGVELGWNRSHGEVRWPNGTRADIRAAESPEKQRGPNLNFAWVDEPGSMGRTGADIWPNLMFALRIPLADGAQPRVVISGTPRRVALMRLLLASAGKAGWVVTRGRTTDNAENLAPEALQAMVDLYAGTRLGRQELDGEMLEDVEGALWRLELIDNTRVDTAPPMRRIVVAMDPAAKGSETSDMMGIVGAGVGFDGRAYVLGDRSDRLSPAAAVKRAAALYDELKADAAVVEANNGGDWLAAVWSQVAPSVPVKLVHASRGKLTRAEPIAALYEQGRVSHVGRELQALEDQMTSWVPGEASPDRMDALVWALTELMGQGPQTIAMAAPVPRPVSTGY